MPKIFYEEDNILVEEEDTSLTFLEISKKHNIPHIHECGGEGRCSTCRIIVLEDSKNISDRNELEEELARSKGFECDIRLACQTKPTGDVKIRRLVIDTEDIEIAIAEKSSTSGKYSRVAILFSDIRNFTRFSEETLPYDVIHLLNRYYKQMGQAVLDHNGYIDKYIGDGLMAIFGMDGKESPETVCLNALLAAEQMKQKLIEFNQYSKTHFNVEFKIGIGIHYGYAIVGEIGHTQKKQLTAIGDSVNFASRIESKTKKAETDLLASEEFYKIVSSRVQRGRIFKTKLKGKTGEYLLYEILNLNLNKPNR